jgi:hypothetical protein
MMYDNSANEYGYMLDHREFSLKIYNYFGININAFSPKEHEKTLKVKLRQCVKNPTKFNKLCEEFLMNHVEMLSIIFDKYPEILNKKTKQFIRDEYDLCKNGV